ncbi:hypothetical protein IPL68_01730 [Candidatus Saccharibacteria bacterium]|nr:MAG: hypothetical protein IPL68_01730 [Candidatus Saccharibacteria bacterium]
MNKQKGSVQSFIILILAVLLVVAIGFIVLKQNNTKDNKTSSPELTKTEQTSTTEKSEIDKDAVKFQGRRTSSSNGAFSVVIPNGWKIINDTAYDLLSSGPNVSNMSYNSEKEPIIINDNVGGWDGYSEYFYIQKSKSTISPSGESTKFILNNGQSGSKYTSKTLKGTNSEAYGMLTDNYYVYSYVFEKANTQYLAAFAIMESTTIDRSLIDEVVKTLEIL